jgi:hypothetical protein
MLNFATKLNEIMSVNNEDGNKKLHEALLEELQSIEEDVVVKALDKIKEKGNVKFITPMLDAFEDTDSDLVREMIRVILSELKVSAGVAPLVEGLQRRNDELNEIILFALWHADFNPIHYLEDIVIAACEGSYMTALEGLTLIENLEGPFPSEKVVSAKLVVDEYIKEKGKEGDKNVLIIAIQEHLIEFSNFIKV